MKRNHLFSAVIVAAATLLAITACKKETNEPNLPKKASIEFTTNKEVGAELYIYVRVDKTKADSASVWFDLNNNGKREADEEVNNWSNGSILKVKNSKFTLYGNVKEINISTNGITSMKVIHNEVLESLFATNNELKSLNVSQLPEIKSIDCAYNKFTKVGIEPLLNSLPDRPGKTEGSLNLTGGENADVTPEQVAKAKDELNWQVNKYV